MDCRDCLFDSCTPCKPFHIEKLRKSGFLNKDDDKIEAKKPTDRDLEVEGRR